MVGAGSAGSLDAFETEATDKRGRGDEGRESPYESDSDDGSVLGEVFGAVFGELFKLIVILPGAMSLDREGVDTDVEGWEFERVKTREKGELLLPNFQFEVSGLLFKKRMYGSSVRAEVGYGPVAMQYTNSYFYEPAFDDHMTLHATSFIYRMSLGSRFTVGLGGGYSELVGNNNTAGGHGTFPIHLALSENVVAFYRPILHSFGVQSTYDQSVGLYVRRGHFAVKAEYRNFSAGNEVIHGGGIGVSVCY